MWSFLPFLQILTTFLTLAFTICGGLTGSKNLLPIDEEPERTAAGGKKKKGGDELVEVVVHKKPPPALLNKKGKPALEGGGPPRKKWSSSTAPTEASWTGINPSEDIELSHLVPIGDCDITGDSGLEARLRHIELCQNNFHLRLKLQKEEITRGNYKAYFKKMGKIKHTHHPEKEMDREERAKLLEQMHSDYDEWEILKEQKILKRFSKRITWTQKAQAYIVYGFDECRGEAEYDEDTMDDKEWKGLKHFLDKQRAKKIGKNRKRAAKNKRK